ncbi:MAG: glycosyltransferase family 29 protein [Bacteroidota bacterium]
MDFIKKTIYYILGGLLYLRFTRNIRLDEIFRDKRVAIIGAADSAYQSELGDFIDQFDVIIRINKAPHVIKENKHTDKIGRKTDVLYHSFFENEKFGGGKLDFDLYDQIGIEYVINPISNSFGDRNIFNFYKKYLAKRMVYKVPRTQFQDNVLNFGKFRPTIGYLALCYCLEADFKELYISGFTFFRTNYGKDYRKELETAEQVRKTMREMQIHDPDLEFEEFMKRYNQNIHKHIIIDDTLKSIIKDYTRKLSK